MMSSAIYKTYNCNEQIRRRNRRRRKKQLIRRMVFGFMTLAMVIGFLAFGNSFISSRNVQASGAYEQEICYQSIQVEEGDTLWTIADQYMPNTYRNKDQYIKEIRKINSLNDNSPIIAGTYLMVPFAETIVD